MTMHVRRRASLSLAAVAVATAALVPALGASSASADPTRTSSGGQSLRQVCRVSASKHATVVLVHGAFANTAAWSGEVDALTHAGCTARAISNPLRDLTTDAQTVADFAKAQPGPVLLVGHSYGGSVITNAGAEAPNVVGLVFVDAAAPAPGETTAQLSGADSAINTTPADQVFDKVPYGGAPAGATDMYLKEKFFLTRFAQDLPRAKAAELWATQDAAATNSLGGVSEYAAWQTLPSWYFISTGDQIITPTSELAQAKRAHSHVTVFRGGSHVTLVSHPDAVTAVIAKALAGSLATR